MNLWEKKKWLVIGGIILACLGFGLWEQQPRELHQGTLPVRQEATETQKRRETAKICVYVSGAVQAPGLYYVKPGIRYQEAIVQAGGMTEDADETRVNLAKKCKDGCQVNVPFQKGTKNKKSSSKGSLAKSSSGSSSGAAAGAAAGTALTGGKVNVNTATAEELESLPGIGPSLAQRIIAQRQKASFQSVEDLLQVSGIGRGTLAKFQDRLEV